MPEIRVLARENRAFLRRAVRYMAEQGIRQFIDIGSGLPTAGNTHEVAQEVHPDARVVYVDNDPIVLVHGRALLATDANTTVATADMRRPSEVLEHPEEVAAAIREQGMDVVVDGLRLVIGPGDETIEPMVVAATATAGSGLVRMIRGSASLEDLFLNRETV